jgi:hypothetical protein
VASRTTRAWTSGFDQFTLALFLIVALRWRDPVRTISIALYAYRLIGFVLFEATGERALLLLFPNVFEFWFILVAAVGDDRVARWPRGRIAAVLVLLTLVKEVQEWALHGARLFDSITALDAIDQVWRRLTGR